MRTLLLVAALVCACPSAAYAAAPTNDNFADAIDLNATSAEFDSLSGTNIAASKEIGEPDHAGNAGGHSVWYTWTAPADGSVPNVAFRLFGDFDTLLAVYTGSTVDALTEIASNDDIGFFASSSVSFATTPGQAYAVAVDGFAGKLGRFDVIWNEAPANDNFGAAIALAGASGSRSGDTVRGATSELGEPRFGSGQSVWYSWTPPANGTYKFATTRISFDTVLAIYEGTSLETLELLRANDDDPDRGCCTSWVPLVDAQATTTYMIQVAALDIDDHRPSSFGLQWGPLVLGTSASETLVGTPNAEEIRARGGNDTVLARGGNDLVFGGTGNDALRGGGGADLVLDHHGVDLLAGRAGTDRLDARDFRRGDTLIGGADADVCRADRGDVRRRC
jgi:hypothetical protein